MDLDTASHFDAPRERPMRNMLPRGILEHPGRPPKGIKVPGGALVALDPLKNNSWTTGCLFGVPVCPGSPK